MSNKKVDINVDGNNNIIIQDGTNIKIISPRGDIEKLRQIITDLSLTQEEIVSTLEEKIQSIFEQHQQDLLIELKGIIEGNSIGANSSSWDLDCTEENMPLSPFIGNLQPFKERDACIYYSRTHAVLELFNKIKSYKARHTIYLLYGQTGVGKSSFLNAGLKPRLNKEVEEPIGYQELSLFSDWFWNEQDIPSPIKNKRTLLVFDQFELVFTAKGEELVMQTIKSITNIFSDADPNQLSILLCFRKEYLADVEKLFQQTNLNVSFIKKMLAPLNIGEIKHYLRAPFLKNHYNLTIEERFIDNLATKLTLDSQASIVPILQLTLHKLWQNCSEANKKIFDDALYKKHIKEGNILKNYLLEQLTKTREKYPLWFDSGLVLCILKCHASNQGYTKMISLDELKNKFDEEKISSKDLEKLICFLSDDTKLLVRLKHKGIWNSRLMHDTLAPHINSEFKYSNQKGPKAVKVLKSHQAVYGKKMTTATRRLSKTELTIVQNGKNFMPSWTADEVLLVEESAKYHKKKGRRNIIFILIILGIGLVLFVIDWQQKKHNAYIALEDARDFYKNGSIDDAAKKYRNLFETGFWEDSLIMDLGQIVSGFSYTYQLKHIEDYYQLLETISKKNQKRLNDAICKETYSELAFLFFLNKSLKKASAIFARYGDTTAINNDKSFVTTFSNVFDKKSLSSLVKKYFPKMVHVEVPNEQNAYYKTIKKDYWIGKYELTVERFLYYLNINNIALDVSKIFYSYEDEVIQLSTFGWNGTINSDQLPVSLSNLEAKQYVEWVGGHLPSEAEWEFAAKGGNKQDPYEYAGDSILDNVAVYRRIIHCLRDHPYAPRGPSFVGSKKANYLGIFDMTGNLYEWTSTLVGDNYSILKGGNFLEKPPPCSKGLKITNPKHCLIISKLSGVRVTISHNNVLVDFF